MMKMKMQSSFTFRLIVCLGVIIIILLQACSQLNSTPVISQTTLTETMATGTKSLPSSDDIGDGGFISGEPCAAPCFLGIVPGQTDKNEVLQILEEKEVQHCQVWEKKINVGPLHIICDPYRVFIFSDLEIVDEIVFIPSQIITAQEVLEKYGEPKHLSVSPHTDDSGGVVSVTMAIYYEDPYIGVSFVDQTGPLYNLEETTQVLTIYYNTPGHYAEYLKKITLGPWMGYGEYQINGY